MSERGRDPEGAVAYALAHAGVLLGLPNASLAITLPLLLVLLDDGECSLCTVTFYANLAHSLTRSP